MSIILLYYCSTLKLSWLWDTKKSLLAMMFAPLSSTVYDKLMVPDWIEELAWQLKINIWRTESIFCSIPRQEGEEAYFPNSQNILSTKKSSGAHRVQRDRRQTECVRRRMDVGIFWLQGFSTWAKHSLTGWWKEEVKCLVVMGRSPNYWVDLVKQMVCATYCVWACVCFGIWST